MAVPSPSFSLSKHSLSNSPSFHASNPSLDPSKASVLGTQNVFGSKANLGGVEQTHLRLWNNLKTNSDLRLQASREPPGLTKELKTDKSERMERIGHGSDLFDEMKQRFLSFKKHKYMQNLELYEKLAKGQAPKFMVIACADSRVCPSSILGFQPGEAFVIRNVANMVPPYENGPSETNAGLEFAVNSLKVENILVIGHSQCGGIRALMSMHDDVETSSLIGSWVSVGMNARVRTKAATKLLNFDQQCKHCEKESVNCSLANLLTYPWVEEKVRNGELAIHGGYYDFVDCAFEKWTLDYKESNLKDKGGRVAIFLPPHPSPPPTSIKIQPVIAKSLGLSSLKAIANHNFPLFVLLFFPPFVISSLSLMNSQTILGEARQLLEVTLPELPMPELPNSLSLMNSQTILVEARQLLEVTLPELPMPELPKLPPLPEFPKPELPEFEIPKLLVLDDQHTI
ncbi:hypothetical protein NC653_037650 [Populus alba x Populus x berolinensis]|uniref:carbonic anhydrase n=2 Tax=Populus TaxID=3689 RepID=A0A4U5NAL9_POPAL|nr:hypothetical protein NC653_037650 [Populus alba x Populus x berolinensis]TKR79754.1 hypothetical protein D5086_0000269150 [Populus alba]